MITLSCAGAQGGMLVVSRWGCMDGDGEEEGEAHLRQPSGKLTQGFI